MPIEDTFLKELQQLRQGIHQYPEVSGEERETAAKLKKFVAQYGPDRVMDGVGGDGLIFIFEGKAAGPTVMIRAELDALLIQEINDLSYLSKNKGKAHLCGHDGHMTIVAGVASRLAENRPKTGRVALLFQPAEETGEGAGRVLADERFEEVKPDFIFALHNLPGYKKHEIIVKEGIFTAASKGLIITLKGKTSHAAEPENGISPALAVAEMIQMIENLPSQLEELQDFTLTTVVHATIGERAFGVTPGTGVVMTTIRAYQNNDLAVLEKAIQANVQAIATKSRLEFSIDDTEIFSATNNDIDCCGYIEDAARELGLSVTEVSHPFRWSEDFGLFTQKFKGAFFGLGSGEKTPDLHNPNYNFPDDITGSGILMFYTIIDKLLNRENA